VLVDLACDWRNCSANRW